ncbi:uncharacterized protein [Coffea arabica]|uniref:CCHC-type domain-containing protein n=1 Tax=Coffea arabica TaxID=13443 RepID=A0ABM4WN18_COFAR
MAVADKFNKGSFPPTFGQFFENLSQPSSPLQCRLVRWQAAGTGIVTLNIDGCSKGNPGTSGGGGVFRASDGQALVGYSVFLGVGTSLRAEVLALLADLRFCGQKGFTQCSLVVSVWFYLCFPLAQCVSAFHNSTMAKDLEKLCVSLSIQEGESSRVVLPLLSQSAMQLNSSLYLLGIISMRPVNMEALAITVKGVWRPPHGMSHTIIGDNIALFRFFHRADKTRVLLGSPWSFDQKLLILPDYQGDVPPSKIPFSHCCFWVQVFNVPLDLMSIESVKVIGECLGSFVDVDTDADGLPWGKYIRIRVSLDITQLLRRMMLISHGGEELRLLLQYERILNICFYCGRFGHGDRECEYCLSNPAADKRDLPFKAWAKFNSGALSSTRVKTTEKLSSKVRASTAGGDVQQDRGKNDQDAHNSCDENATLSSLVNQEPNITSGDKDLTLNKSLQSTPNHVENATTIVIVADKDTIFNSNTVCKKGHSLIREMLEDISSTVLIDDGPDQGSLLHCPAVASLDAHLSSQVVERLKSKINFFGISVDADGRSGGLALLWAKNIDISILSFFHRYIDAVVRVNPDMQPWRITGVYDEFEGSGPRPQWQIDQFRDALAYCDLSDLGFDGYRYTWFQNASSHLAAKARLDRACANPAWCLMFPWSFMQHLFSHVSDHSPIMVAAKDRPSDFSTRRRRPFRFEVMWLKSDDCARVIQR